MKPNLLNFVLVFFTLTIAINITGCKDDIIEDADVKKSYLSKLSYYFFEYNIITNYFYDDEHKIIRYDVVDYGKCECEYNTNDLIEKKSFYTPEGTLFSYDVFEYNLDNKIEKIIHYGKAYKKYLPFQDDYFYFKYNKSIVTIEKSSWETLFYNSEGNIIKVNFYNTDDIQTGYTEYMYDANGNVSKEIYYIINSDTSEYKEYETTYTYDDKNYILKNVVGFKIYPNYYNKNNELGNNWIYYNEDGTISDTYKTSCTYEYNEDDFPIKRIDDNGDYIEYEYIKEF